MNLDLTLALIIWASIALGVAIATVTPFVVKWLARSASHAQLSLDVRRHQVKASQGKQAPTLQQKTAGGTP